MSRLTWIFRFAADKFSDGKKIGGWWYGVVGEKSSRFANAAAELEFEGVNEEFVTHYFGLNDDLEQISRCIGKDEYIRKALKSFVGLRIVRQNPWECLISFICATYKNIAAIEHDARQTLGEVWRKKGFRRQEFYTFPTAETLASASDSELENAV